MTQSPPSIQTINKHDAADGLSACLEAGLHVTATIDPLADNSLVPTFFNESPHLSYQVLFLGTPLEHVLAASPYAVAIGSIRDAFCQHLLDHPGGWGFFAVSSMSLEETAAHWKSLLQIHSDNIVTHFRFYDRQILHSLWPALNPADAADLLGPHSCLHLPPPLAGNGREDEKDAWSKLSHPSCDSPQAIAGRYELRASPWWILTDEHWRAFEDKRPGIMTNNIKEHLFETYPSQAGAQHAKIRLDEFCLSHVQRAEALGINDQETVKHFVACCMLFGDNFMESSGIRIPPAPGREASLAVELRNLCEKAVLNG
jgi:hypothetical protein